MTYMHHLLRFLLEQSVLASRGALPLFTELPIRGLLGNRPLCLGLRPVLVAPLACSAASG